MPDRAVLVVVALDVRGFKDANVAWVVTEHRELISVVWETGADYVVETQLRENIFYLLLHEKLGEHSLVDGVKKLKFQYSVTGHQYSSDYYRSQIRIDVKNFLPYLEPLEVTLAGQDFNVEVLRLRAGEETLVEEG